MEILDKGFNKKPDIDPKELSYLKLQVYKCQKDLDYGKAAAYVVAFFTIVGGFLSYAQGGSLLDISIEVIFYFIVFAIAYKFYFDFKPKAALMIIVGTYLFQHILVMVLTNDPSTLVNGFILKILILYF